MFLLQSMNMNVPCLMWCIKWNTRNRNEEREVLMNPNCKWKRDNDSSVKERKTKKRKYKRNSYLLVY